MAWTEQDYQEIVARLKQESQGINDVPEAEDLEGITALPAYQSTEGEDTPNIVRAPLTLLAVPALDAAVIANKAAENANDTANHPTYIGSDNYAYKWNKTTKEYEKTDVYVKGDPGIKFVVVGQFDTPELLKQAIPDGSDVNGVIAVGTVSPYDYYAWVNGEWKNQGKMAGMTEAPSDGKAYARKNGVWVETVERSEILQKDKTAAYLDLTDVTLGASLPYTSAFTKEKINDWIKYGSGKIMIISEYNGDIAIINAQIYGLIFEDDDKQNAMSGTIYGVEYFVNSNTGNITIVSNAILEFDETAYTYKNTHSESNLVASDNITNITKKTSAEYTALTTKDAKTMYAVTD